MSFLTKLKSIFFRDSAPGGSAEETAVAALLPEEQAVVEKFETQFGIRFNDQTLLATALRHRSYLNQTNQPRSQSNERLEFLGDAVVDLVATHFLYAKLPKKTEGHLSKIKSILVSKPVMGDIAGDLKLGDLMLMNRGEEKTGGRNRRSIIADAFEAIIGAIYLDQGLPEARKFIETYLLANYKQLLLKAPYRNFKSILLEYGQSNGDHLPDYRIIKEFGPDHAKEFVIEVWLGNRKLGEGHGKSKKIAEQEAARQAVVELDLDETLG